MLIKQQIIVALKDALSKLGVADIEPLVEIPQDSSHGDYCTNLAMVIANRLKRNPMEVAQQITAKLKVARLAAKRESGKLKVENVKVVKPGFINFWLPQESISNYLNDLLSQKDAYASIKVAKPHFEMYENTQPNTNKPLHIGHLRNIALGSSIVHIRKTLGHKVWSVNINNDRGIHIMKAMWAYLAYGKELIANGKIEKPEKDWKDLLQNWAEDSRLWETPETAVMKADHFVGQFYVLGERAEKAFGETVTQQFQEMLRAWEEDDLRVRKLWKQMNEWFYIGFRQTHGRFAGIDPQKPQFDKEWFESQVYAAGKEIVLDNLDKGLFYRREDGPIVADLKKYGLPDKVVVRSDGTSIYITQDLELARIRMQEEKTDFTAYIVGNEQDLHFKQLFAICEELSIGKKDQFLHISYGMINLTGGVKMSSREGTAVVADELMDSVADQVRSLFDTKDEKVAEQVAIGAIKYWMLKYNPKAAISFDINESVSIHGNSGPYLQYAFARTQSVLEKAKSNKQKAISKPSIQSTTYNLQPEEMFLLRLLYRFPEIVEEAALKFSPNLLCNYLFEVAKAFNLFYQKHSILKSDQQAFRLALTETVGIVIKQGLHLLGIAAPSKM